MIPLLARKQSNGDGIAPAAESKDRFQVYFKVVMEGGHPLMLSYPYMDPQMAKKQSNRNGVTAAALDMSKCLTLRLGSDFSRASMTMELGR